MQSYSSSNQVPGIAFVFGSSKEIFMGPNGGEVINGLICGRGGICLWEVVLLLSSQVFLASLFIFLSCFKCPKTVVQCLEKIQSDFLRIDTTDKKIITWLNGSL